MARGRAVQPTFVADDASREICQPPRRHPPGPGDGRRPAAVDAGQAEIAARLEERFRLLVGGRRAAGRQQTLRATVAWSHDLLDDRERRVFRRLAVFAGSFGLDAAEAVTADDDLDVLDVDDLLGSLVAKSLVVAEPVRRRRAPATGCWRRSASTPPSSSTPPARPTNAAAATPSTTPASWPTRRRSARCRRARVGRPRRRRARQPPGRLRLGRRRRRRLARPGPVRPDATVRAGRTDRLRDPDLG